VWQFSPVPFARRSELSRHYSDIDFTGHARQTAQIKRLFVELGYLPQERFNALHGSRQLVFVDGSRKRRVDICTSPNTNFIRRLLGSLGLRTRVRVHRGYGYVSISCQDAALIQIFNPYVSTYRRMALERLAFAKVFRGKWPNWLNSRVHSLIRVDLNERQISESILSEYGVYLRMRTIKKDGVPF